MKRAILTLALAGALLPLGTPLLAEQLTEDDFDDRGTGLVLRPMEGVENLDGPSGRIPKAPAPPRPALPPPVAPQPEPAKPPPKKKVSGRSMVAADARKSHAKRSVSRLELASILDKYLDYIKQQKAEIEQKMEAFPIQKGLAPEVLARMDKLFKDLDHLSAEEGNLGKMVKELSGTVHEQGVEVHKLKIADMIADRRLDRLERATGLSKKTVETEPTPEEAAQADRMVQRVERLEDLLQKSLGQLAEATTRLEGIEQNGAVAAGGKAGAGITIAARSQARIPFAGAGGVTIGAEREAYRQKLLARVKEAIAARETEAVPAGDRIKPAAVKAPAAPADDEAPAAAPSDEGSAAPTEPSASDGASATESAPEPAQTAASSAPTDDSSSDPDDDDLPNIVDDAKGGQ